MSSRRREMLLHTALDLQRDLAGNVGVVSLGTSGCYYAALM